MASLALLAPFGGGCDDEADEGPNKPSAPIPTTPPHRRPMDPGEIKRLEALVAREVAAQQADLKKACWDPVAPDAGVAAPPAAPPAVSPEGEVDKEALKQAATGGVTVQLHFVYGEDGKELSRRVIENPTDHVPGLSDCLDKKLPPTTIPAQNRKVQIRVPMQLP